MNLLIVESPLKVKTIGKYLKNDGSKWLVTATLGHIVDLPEHRHGLSIGDNGDYIGEWVVIDGKKKIIDGIIAQSTRAEKIYIATDDDREGEKIADDVVHYCHLKNYYRVVFHEITKTAIIDGIKNARYVDEKTVLAQKARRFIDREVGYKVSNIIRADFKNRGEEITSGLGVGRVVSPALHLLVIREKEIDAFVTQRQYKIGVDYEYEGVQFTVYFPTVFSDNTKTEMMDILAYLGNAKNEHVVEKYKPGQRGVPPFPPLITSRLLRGCFYLMSYDPSKTMKLAQQLFECGLITYLRTDSYTIADEAVESIIRYLNSKYPEEDVKQSKRVYKQKEGTHDAHEAIRPIYFTDEFSPDNIQTTSEWIDNKLTPEHHKVYEYIWQVTLATQMKDAVYDKSVVEIRVGQNILKAQANYVATTLNEYGEEVEMLGWEKMRGNYLKTAERDADEDYKDRRIYIPYLTVGERLKPINVKETEYQSKRPPRYGIGRFVSVLEEKGIGRPSTFASIYQKLVKTGCVGLIGKQMLQPRAFGIRVDNWITEHAGWMNDIDNAKKFEELLDAIEKGELASINEEIAMYTALIEDLQKTLGIKPDLAKENNLPSEAQIALYDAILSRTGGGAPDDRLLKDRSKMSVFIDKYQKSNTVCKCPSCKTGEIRIHEYEKEGRTKRFFKCSNKTCDLFIGDEHIDKFFVMKGKDFNAEERVDILKKICSKKSGYFMTGFVSKTGKDYNANVILQNSVKEEKSYWSLNLVFEKKGK